MILQGKYNSCNVYTDLCDSETCSQLIMLLNQEFVKDAKIAIMPDCHAGKGCVIGTTMTITDKIVPNLVGVDIGCGMYVLELEETSINFAELDKTIRDHIPYGFSIHQTDKHIKTLKKPGPNQFDVEKLLQGLRCFDKLHDYDRIVKSIGTLGGGNHFLEIDKDPDTEKLYLVIHSGSRNLGKQVAEYYQKLAIQECNQHIIDKTIIEQIAQDCIQQNKKQDIEQRIKAYKQQFPSIPDELAYVSGQSLDDYLHDIKIVQKFAEQNRMVMGKIITDKMQLHVTSSFTTMHNYIDTDKMILRKGSVAAYAGQKLIIPINMRDGALICTGKGNPDWNYSAPHGAGRVMSRSDAKANISLEAFRESMSGIWSSSVQESTIDESPMAYKPMESITAYIKDTVNIQTCIKPVYNFKAS